MTQDNYQSFLCRYFMHLGKLPQEYLKDPHLLGNEQKISLLDGYEDDIEVYLVSLHEKAPRTQLMARTILKTFYEDNHIEFENRFWKNLSKRGKGSATVIEDINPEHEQLQKLISIADIKGKAIILALTSSGMRIDELIHLQLNDIDFTSAPVKVTIRGRIAKNKRRCVTFFSLEAMDAINAWLKIREEYLKRCNRPSNLYHRLEDGTIIRPAQKNIHDGRLFPMSEMSVRANIWIPLIKKTGLDQKDDIGHYKLRLHSCRKFFLTQGSKGKGGRSFAEQLSNHIGYLSQYHEITDENRMKELYLDMEKHLAIKPVYAMKDTQMIKEMKSEIHDLRIMVNALEKLLFKDNPGIKLPDL